MYGITPDGMPGRGSSVHDAGAAFGRTTHRLTTVTTGILGGMVSWNWYQRTGDSLLSIAKGVKMAWLWYFWGFTFLLMTVWNTAWGALMPFAYLWMRHDQHAIAWQIGSPTPQPDAYWATLMGSAVGGLAFNLIAIPFILGTLYQRQVEESLFKKRRLYYWLCPYSSRVRNVPSVALYVFAWTGVYWVGIPVGLVTGLVVAVL